MKTNRKFNYFYNGVAITKSQFLAAVPENWESEVNELGEYTYGYYRTNEIEGDSPELDAEPTFDVHFNNEESSSNKGFSESLEFCRLWIKNRPEGSYFEDYKGGTVSIVCNETGETVFSEDI